MKIYPVLSELLSVLCQNQLVIPQCFTICEMEVYIFVCAHFYHFLHVTIMFFLSHGCLSGGLFKQTF